MSEQVTVQALREKAKLEGRVK